MTFSEVVEAIKTLSLEEKEEIQFLLEQFLREEQRDEVKSQIITTPVKYKPNRLKSF